jgi:hypothetical protein
MIATASLATYGKQERKVDKYVVVDKEFIGCEQNGVSPVTSGGVETVYHLSMRKENWSAERRQACCILSLTAASVAFHIVGRKGYSSNVPTSRSRQE